MLRNHRTMTLKLSRHEVCDLLIALAAAKDASNAKRWEELHDRIRSMLNVMLAQLLELLEGKE